jgi:two-component system, NtrC family, nitrogen regulation response regulator GlnG
MTKTVEAADGRVLLVDDEANFVRSATLALRLAGLRDIDSAGNDAEAMAKIRKRDYDVILLDIHLPEKSGIELLENVQREHPDSTVCMLTAVNDVPTALHCLRAGAFDYLVKPVTDEQLVSCVQKAFAHRCLQAEAISLKRSLLEGGPRDPSVFDGIHTTNASLWKIFQYMEVIAPTALPVLILGETGVGKEGMAQLLHRLSGRAGKFVTINVAGIDDNVFTDTLFGHARGAFTGADRERKGLIEEAAEGTLFLDEIGDLKTESQVKLLRLLQEGTFHPLGSDRQSRSTARVVVATNRDLAAMLYAGSFRRDLYYRLQFHEIRLPPLRDRLDDLPLLARALVEEAAREFGKPTLHLPEQLFPLLENYTWPGNIRELKAVLTDAVGRSSGATLALEPMRERLNRLRGEMTVTLTQQPEEVPGDKNVIFKGNLPTLREMEALLTREAVKRTGGNRSQAADLLGVARQTVIRRLQLLEQGEKTGNGS